VSDPWQLLRNGGLPLALARSPVSPSEPDLAAAARAAIASHPVGRDADALAAWLLAWRDHWPTSFSRNFGGDADSAEAWAHDIASSDGRHIKLRRIALENLASIL
jgi:hypothetical protein